MTWFRVTLSADQVTAGELPSYQERFDEAFTAARGPREMALFKRERDDGGVDLFLTPQCWEYAADLVDEWQCVACERPSLIGLQLVVGHNEITYYMP